MKADWQTKKLGDICSFENGDRGTNYPSRSSRTNQGIPFVNAGHLTDNGIDIDSLDYISRERFDLLNNGKIRRGDILFCLRGSLGKFASVGSISEGAIASSLVIIRPRETVLNAYVLAYLQSSICADMISRFKNGAAQPNLSAQSLSNFIIPLPNRSEQQRIVSILDKALDGIAAAKANAEKNLQNARALFESHLEAVFAQHGQGWAEKRLVDVCLLQRGFDLPMRSRTEGKFPLVSSSGVIDTHNIGIVRGPGVATGRSGSIGNVFFIEKDFWPLNTVLYVKQFFGNDPKFIYRLLGHFDLKRFATGTGVPTLNRNFVHDEVVRLPESRAKQRAIADQLDSLAAETQRLESIYKQKRAALEALKESILHQAFTGAL